MSALNGAIEDRLEFSITPALLNMHSTGTLPGLMARYILAISDKYGKSVDLCFQNSSAVWFASGSQDRKRLSSLMKGAARFRSCAVVDADAVSCTSTSQHTRRQRVEWVRDEFASKLIHVKLYNYKIYKHWWPHQSSALIFTQIHCEQNNDYFIQRHSVQSKSTYIMRA